MIVRDMGEAEATAVAEMIRSLARDTGSAHVPKLDAEKLAANRDLVHVLVAEEEGRLIGACLTLATFSTWRGERGLYVVDLFVDRPARNRQVGRQLLAAAARRGAALGAAFVKLEVDPANQDAARFYERLGFRKKRDELFVLERQEFSTLLNGKESP